MDKKNIRITLITEYFPPEIGAGSNRAFENASEWVKMGAKVTVLTGFPDYPDGKIPAEYKGYVFKEETLNGIRVIRTFTVPAPNKGHFKRIISFFSFMFSSVIQGTFSLGKQDIIIATSPPFFVGISGYLISRLKRIPFVFEVRDLWPESITQLGQIKSKMIIRPLEFLEIFLYQKAAKIVLVTDSYLKILKKKGITERKMVVIKNGVSSELLASAVNSNSRLGIDLDGKFVITYIGTLGISHALDKVLQTAELLLQKNKIFFLFVGEGAEKEKLKNLAKDLRLDNIKFINKVNKNELDKYYSISSVLLVPLKNVPLFQNVIPSKIFEIMAFKKPILISVDGEARKIVEEANAGFFVCPEDINDLKEKILYLYNNPSLLIQLGENGRKYVEKNFNREQLAKQYYDLLSKLVK